MCMKVRSSVESSSQTHVGRCKAVLPKSNSATFRATELGMPLAQLAAHHFVAASTLGKRASLAS